MTNLQWDLLIWAQRKGDKEQLQVRSSDARAVRHSRESSSNVKRSSFPSPNDEVKSESNSHRHDAAGKAIDRSTYLRRASEFVKLHRRRRRKLCRTTLKQTIQSIPHNLQIINFEDVNPTGRDWPSLNKNLHWIFHLFSPVNTKVPLQIYIVSSSFQFPSLD